MQMSAPATSKRADARRKSMCPRCTPGSPPGSRAGMNSSKGFPVVTAAAMRTRTATFRCPRCRPTGWGHRRVCGPWRASAAGRPVEGRSHPRDAADLGALLWGLWLCARSPRDGPRRHLGGSAARRRYPRSLRRRNGRRAAALLAGLGDPATLLNQFPATHPATPTLRDVYREPLPGPAPPPQPAHRQEIRGRGRQVTADSAACA